MFNLSDFLFKVKVTPQICTGTSEARETLTT